MPELDLEQLLSDFNEGTRISKLEATLGMPAKEIIQIMKELSREDPETWNPDRVKVYQRGMYQRQYRLKEEFPESMTILLGYNIGNVQLTDGQLRIFIDEPVESLCMEDVLVDFRENLQKLRYDVSLKFDSEPNTVVLSPEPYKRVEKRSMRFLEAVKYAFQAQYSR